MHDVTGVPRDGLEFLQQFSRRLRCLHAPAEIHSVAARLLGEWLGVERVEYAEPEASAEALRMLGEWRKPGGVVETGASFTYRVVKQDLLVAAIIVHHAKARRWSDAETFLIRDAGERTWEAVERARAEERLRTSEVRRARLEEMLCGELVGGGPCVSPNADPSL